MEWIVGIYGIQFLILLILVIGSWFIWDRRFKTKHGNEVPKDFHPTPEIFIDPTTAKRFIVYYNPTTGERFYREEDSN